MKIIALLSVLMCAVCVTFAEDVKENSSEMIEVEVRFIEVSQDELTSMGFEWSGMGGRRMDTYDDSATSPLTAGFDRLATHPTDGDTGIINAAANFTTILHNTQLDMALHALSSQKNMEATAKVVTKSGHRATIRSVIEYIYPTKYEKQYAVTSSGAKTTQYVAPAVPGNFQMREVGVIFDVTPTVDSRNEMIVVDMKPEIVGEPWWVNYGDGIEQPFFAVRSVAMQMHIYNGCTVVMGGLITERTEIEDTRFPVLWRISKIFGEKKEIKRPRNLLIFVTATVKPTNLDE